MIDSPSAPPRVRPERQEFDDSIDLKQLAHSIWRRKALVVLTAIGGAALGLTISTLSTKYVSEGLLLAPSVLLEQYKQYEIALANEPRLQQFLNLSGQQESAAGRLLLDIVRTPGGISEAVQPAFTHTDRDAKQFGIKMDNPSGFVGIRLKVSQADKTQGKPVRLLAEYVRDTAIKVDLDNSILHSCLAQQTRELELRNLQIEDDFKVRQQQAKVESLKQIIGRTPGAAAIDNRQIVSLENGTERFLSPVAQIVAAEVAIADLEFAQSARERELVAANMKKDYYCQARDVLEKPGTGREFLLGLKGLQSASLSNREMSLEIVEHTANAFDVEREKWNSAYLDQMRFVVAPEGGEVRVRKPGRIVGTVVGGVLGLLLGLVMAMAQAWWRVNREIIVAHDD